MTAPLPLDPAAPVFRLLAQCAPGLEPLLLAELQSLGIRATALQGGARWSGGWADLVGANLHLRVASRVLVELGSFRARALGELERKAAGLPWDRVPRGRPARFRVSASRSRLYHEGAIEERLRRAADLPPEDEARNDESPDDGPLVVVRVHRDEVTVRLDTSGEHLHRRGYRLHVGAAPLRETLAAALVLAGPGRSPGAVVDPFCGSGTVIIEAALAARHIAPGLAQRDRVPRDYAFRGWPDLPEAVWNQQVAEARAAILPPPDAVLPPRFLGSDRDASVVEAARSNAVRAGVEASTSFADAPLSKAPLPAAWAAGRAAGRAAGSESAPNGGHAPSHWVVTNPPYGTRLGERRGLRALYGALGRAFRPEGHFGSACALLYLSGDPVLDAATGLSMEERFATSHGGLRVRAMTTAPPAGTGDGGTGRGEEGGRGAFQGGGEEPAPPGASTAPRSEGPDAPEA